jgi:uncharacterized protein YqfB (UPF0267 family)
LIGWDENSAHELTRYIVNKLDNNEKETLDEDINLDEISKVIKILKPNKLIHYRVNVILVITVCRFNPIP